jgi:hypothetical protein
MSLCVSRRNPDPRSGLLLGLGGLALLRKNARQTEPGLNQILVWI